jgi:hypothetical protein
VLNSLSIHDSQVAIALVTMTNRQVTSLYVLMDSAYDAPQNREHSCLLGHVSMIDINLTNPLIYRTRISN